MQIIKQIFWKLAHQSTSSLINLSVIFRNSFASFSLVTELWEREARERAKEHMANAEKATS